jgi:hypothetical protein
MTFLPCSLLALLGRRIYPLSRSLARSKTALLGASFPQIQLIQSSKSGPLPLGSNAWPHLTPCSFCFLLVGPGVCLPLLAQRERSPGASSLAFLPPSSEIFSFLNTFAPSTPAAAASAASTASHRQVDSLCYYIPSIRIRRTRLFDHSLIDTHPQLSTSTFANKELFRHHRKTLLS